MEVYQKVKVNWGVVGVDGVCIIDFDEKRVLELCCLEKEFRMKVYCLQVVKWVYILKFDGSECLLGILMVCDWVVQ